MGDYASKGVAGSGLGLGIAGTALGVLKNVQLIQSRTFITLTDMAS